MRSNIDRIAQLNTIFKKPNHKQATMRSKGIVRDYHGAIKGPGTLKRLLRDCRRTAKG